jgi:hypothetical protein
MIKGHRIGTRLVLEFGIVILMTGVIGWVGIRGVNTLAGFFTDIYNHLVVVSNAVHDIKINVLSAQINLENMLHDSTEQQILECSNKSIQSRSKKRDRLLRCFP